MVAVTKCLKVYLGVGIITIVRIRISRQGRGAVCRIITGEGQSQPRREIVLVNIYIV